MTIRQRIPQQSQQQQPTQATTYYKGLKERLERQQQLRVPRSQNAWGAEEARLGAWNTGVGRLYDSGAAAGYVSGEGKIVFRFDPEEVEQNQRRSAP